MAPRSLTLLMVVLLAGCVSTPEPPAPRKPRAPAALPKPQAPQEAPVSWTDQATPGKQIRVGMSQAEVVATYGRKPNRAKANRWEYTEHVYERVLERGAHYSTDLIVHFDRNSRVVRTECTPRRYDW